MTQTSFPFEGIDTTETQFSQWARNIGEGFFADSNGDRLAVAAGTGLAVDVDPGRALVRGHFYVSTATEALSLATADVTNDRLDTVVLRLDPTANSIILAVVTGTPAGSPVAPTLTQTDAGTYELAIADVLVPANSGVPTAITDRRAETAAKAGEWPTAGRPATTGFAFIGFNTDLGTLEFYNVSTSAWEPVGGGLGFEGSFLLGGM
jgi:hypothetical protein